MSHRNGQMPYALNCKPLGWQARGAWCWRN